MGMGFPGRQQAGDQTMLYPPSVVVPLSTSKATVPVQVVRSHRRRSLLGRHLALLIAMGVARGRRQRVID